MALILEIVVGRDDVRQRVRLDAAPLTIGRGLANDVILDDPYVDAAHAAIVPDEQGVWWLEDRGSVNGVLGASQTREERIRLVSGTVVRIGRTMLRVRDTSEAVAPALPDRHAVVDEKQPLPLSRRALWGVIGVVTLLVTISAWLTSYEQDSASDQLTTILGFVAIGLMWAGSWAIASRITKQRFHMLQHFAIFSATVLVATVLGLIVTMIAFFLPIHWLSETLSTLNIFVILALLLTAHLAYTSNMQLRRRATVAVAVSALLVLLGITVSSATDADFADAPVFVGVLAPISESLIPARAPAELERVAAELKPDVDALKTDD